MGEFYIVQGAARTGTTGTQDFLAPGFGTPKGAIFMISYGVTAGTATAHAGIHYGMTDGTNQWSISGRNENAVATPDGSIAAVTDKCITILVAAGGSIDGSAAFTSWDPGGVNGVRITWDNVPAAAYLITCILIGGTGVSNVYVGTVDSHVTLNSSTVVTDPGFQSDVILTGAPATNNWSGAESTHNMIQVGAWVRDGSNTQRTFSAQYSAVTDPTNHPVVIDTNSICRYAGAGAGGAELQINTVTSTGFSLQTLVTVTNKTAKIGYMAIKFNGLAFTLMDTLSPIVTGSHAISSIGFTPQFGMMWHSSLQVQNTVVQDEDVEVFGISAFNDTQAGSIAIAEDDNVATTICESISNNTAVSLRKNSAIYQAATLSSFGAGTATFNYTSWDTTTRYRFALFVERGDPQPITATAGSYESSGQAATFRVGSPLYLRHRK